MFSNASSQKLPRPSDTSRAEQEPVSAPNFMRARRDLHFLNLADSDPLDVLIIGGGITGAPIYQTLRHQGYRVALIDKNDFSSGTSQASGMLVWGGLLYLKNLDFATVLKLCKARGELLRDFPDALSVLDLHYRFTSSNRHSSATVWLSLHLYWLMGGCALKRPSMIHHPRALHYQEAMLRESDSRFVIDRICGPASAQAIPLNHCQLVAADFDTHHRHWNLRLLDKPTGMEYQTKAKSVINAGGVWTDELNGILGISSPYKHVFSKGVYLTFPNNHNAKVAEVFPMHDRDDVMTHVPWGPVMMWGPTETKVQRINEGLSPTRDDVRFLLDHAARHLPNKPQAEDVVGIRCGIRPLAVPAHFKKDCYPLDLSRRHECAVDADKRCISLYGGKLTSSLKMADEVTAMIQQWLPARFPRIPQTMDKPERCPTTGFVTPEWARDHEYCFTLEDYLRRRTSIAQWTPRMGLGREGEERESLKKIAAAFASDAAGADAMVNAYEATVRSTYDPLLEL